MGESGYSSNDRRRLLERVREQEGVIRTLWSQYTQDVGREPDVAEIASLPRAVDRRFVPARTEIIRTCLEKEQSFDDAVDEFRFEFTHSHAEAATQRVASKLMHTRRPAVIARKSGDVVLKGFWGRGVSMPVFEKLLQRLKGLQHGSLRRVDLSDNGLNGNFVPGLIELLRRGVRQLDISFNSIESVAMQQLCNALPQIAQYLEVLDLRINPCSSDGAFMLCLASMLPELKYLSRLALTMRALPEDMQSQSSSQTRPVGADSTAHAVPQRRHASLVRDRDRPASAGRRAGATPRSHSSSAIRSGQAASFQRGRHSVSDANSYRMRSSSPSRGHSGVSASAAGASNLGPRIASGVCDKTSVGMGGAAVLRSMGRDSCVALFRSLTQCPQLQALDLKGSCLSREAAQRLSHVLREDRLVVLGLGDCFLGPSVEPVLEAVARCHNLVSLNLRLNAIEGHSAVVLAMALAESVGLTDVDLSSNELDDDFGETFARVLRLNEVLWKVNLIRNPLGVRTGKALLDVLRKRNSSLVSIGDTTDNFFALGLENRYKIQCHLEANRKGMEIFTGAQHGGHAESMDPSLVDFEFKILQDEPPMFEPLVLLG